MIGMSFLSFLILLIIAAIIAAIVHYVFKYYVMPGFGSYLAKVVICWLGGWLGSPVFGYWFKGIQYKQVYIIPAILGSIALVILAVAGLGAFAGKKE